jgi:hypothetical protein
MIFLRTKERVLAIKGFVSFLLFSLAIVVTIIALKLAIKNFLTTDFLAVLLLYLSGVTALSALFLEFKIFNAKEHLIGVNSSVDAKKVEKIIEMAKGEIDSYDNNKSIDLQVGVGDSNGLILDDRTAQNTTTNATTQDIEVVHLTQLFNKANSAKNGYRYRKELKVANNVINDLSSGKEVKKVEVSEVINSLIKILANENFDV